MTATATVPVVDALRFYRDLDALIRHREEWTPQRRRALEAVRDGRVVIRSVPDPPSRIFPDWRGRHMEVSTSHGPCVARAALDALYFAGYTLGERLDTPPDEWAWRAVLKPVGAALLAGIGPDDFTEQYIADPVQEGGAR